MVRDYSTQKEHELHQIIKEIENEQQLDIVDSILDAFNWIKSLLHWFNISDFENNMNEYHRVILDRTNMISGRLAYIFSHERILDESYATSKYDCYIQELSNIINGFNQFTNIINPSASMALTGANVTKIAKQVKKDIEASSKTSQEMIKEVEAAYEKEIIRDAAFNMGKGLLGILGGPVKFTKDFALGNYVEAGSDVWGLINATFQTGSGAVGIVGTGVILGLSSLSGSSKNVRNKYLNQMENYANAGGLTDALRADGDKDLEKVSKYTEGFDNASNMINLVSGIGSLGENAGKTPGILPDGMTLEHMKQAEAAKYINEGAYRNVTSMKDYMKSVSRLKQITNLLDIATDKDRQYSPDPWKKEVLKDINNSYINLVFSASDTYDDLFNYFDKLIDDRNAAVSGGGFR